MRAGNNKGEVLRLKRVCQRSSTGSGSGGIPGGTGEKPDLEKGLGRPKTKAIRAKQDFTSSQTLKSSPRALDGGLETGGYNILTVTPLPALWNPA